MERITAADASFLYMENPVVHMHVTGVLVLDPSTVPGGWSFEKFRAHVIGRLPRIPVFRRRLMEVPLGIDHPVWVDDPDFDIDEHLSCVHIPAPGHVEQLAAFVGEFASHPLDRHVPLWEMVVVEGLADGSVAVVSKVHHVAVDGVTGTDLLAQLVELSPEGGEDTGPDPRYRAETIPNRLELTVGAIGSRVLDPLRGVRALGRAIGSVGRVVREVAGGSEDGHSMARPFDAPRTLFNQSLTPRRSVAFAKAPLADLKLVKSTFGTTVNDVFLAACTQSLRSYLDRRGEHLDRPLVVSVPVSVHGHVTEGRATNQVSNMFVRLPVHLADPVDQLRAVRVDTRDAKVVHGAIGADMIGDVTEVTPPAIFNLASRTYSSAGLADRLAPIHNLVISNVPGPPFPLYVAGAQLVGAYPFGPLVEGAGLNITVLSNMGNMDIGVIACPDIAPDVEEVSSGIVDAIEVLRKAAVVESATAAAGAVAPDTSSPIPAAVTPASDRPGRKQPSEKAAARKKSADKSPSEPRPSKGRPSTSSPSKSSPSGKSSAKAKSPRSKQAKGKPARKAPVKAAGRKASGRKAAGRKAAGTKTARPSSPRAQESGR